MNKHCTYDEGGIASWKLTRYRFTAGEEYNARKKRVGQLMGHIAKVVDASNTLSGGYVPTDLCLVLWEMEESGWRREEFFWAFDRLVRGSPNLSVYYDATISTMNSLEGKGN